jgi:trehalose synthase-fused probable maltokinase
LNRYYEEVELQPAPGPELLDERSSLTLAAEATPPAICELTGVYIDSAQILGRRTAELHLALIADVRTPAFALEPFGREHYERLLADAVGQVRLADDTLALGHIPEEASAAVRRTLDRAREMLSGLQDAQTRKPFDTTASRSRVHGDYHLGQVLWSEGDFYILDFEGEPARSVAERRAKDSPLKDVAGMLRSFSYAAYAALFNRTVGRAEEFDRLEPWARVWTRWVGAAFLKAYLSVAEGAPFLPADAVQRAALLDLYLLDKALYELNYELNNRPDWVRIPLRGLTELLP